eukprot:6182966-Pleurochrysis_carterae.AAC.1
MKPSSINFDLGFTSNNQPQYCGVCCMRVDLHHVTLSNAGSHASSADGRRPAGDAAGFGYAGRQRARRRNSRPEIAVHTAGRGDEAARHWLTRRCMEDWK